MCEALIREVVSFDLNLLKEKDSPAVYFELVINVPGSTYRQGFNYHY